MASSLEEGGEEEEEGSEKQRGTKKGLVLVLDLWLRRESDLWN